MLTKAFLRKKVKTVCAASIVAASLSGCADYADGLIVIRLRALVVSADNHPVKQASIWLKDRRFKDNSQPKSLRNPVCITDDEGKCKVEIRYSYGYTSWPWLRFFRPRPTLSDRFELAVMQDGRLLARRTLAPLAAPQIQGAADVHVSIRLDRKTE